jgi:hypothetical protein
VEARSPAQPAPDAPAAPWAHTDLSAFLSGEARVAAPSALASEPLRKRRTQTVPVKGMVMGACALGLLACGVWLATPPAQPNAALKTGVTALARPTLGLVRTRLADARSDAAARAELEAAEPAQQTAPPKQSRASRKRRRTRRAITAKAQPVARSSAPSTATTGASERVPSRPFDIASANRALGAAAARARFCGNGTASSRSVLATVTFDPSGRVRVLRVTPSPSRSRTSACVAAALRRTRVPAFRGNPVTVSRRVSLTANARSRR